jgi:vacuolar protein sorting-associated protein 51
MEPLNPMASTLDPAIAQIYSQASSIRQALRKTIPPPDSDAVKEVDTQARVRRMRELAREVLATPERLRTLVKEGKADEARMAWDMPRRLLLTWKEKGIGGEDVDACLEEGDAVFRNEEDGESSGRTSRDSET